MAKVITFFGTDAKTGTSLISASMAQFLAKQEKQVLLINASSELGNDYVKGEMPGCLDDLKQLSLIREEDVNMVTGKCGNISYISGVSNILEIRKYSTSTLIDLIGAISRSYDFIIIDGGYNIQYPLPVASLSAAGQRYYVITQNAKTVHRFRTVKDTVLNAMGMSSKNEKIIINKSAKKQAMYSPAQIGEIFDLEYFEVPELKNGHIYELEEKTPPLEGAFEKSLKAIAADFMEEGELPEKKGFFRK